MKVALPVLLAVFSIVQTTPPPKPDPVYTQLRSPKMSGDTASVSGLIVKRDAATFVFNRGEFHFAEPVEGKVLAAVFIGDGEFRIQPPTDVEKHNLEVLIKQSAVVEPFSEVVLHFTDMTYDDMTRGASIKKGRPNGKAASIMDDRMALFRKGKEFSEPNFAAELLNFSLPGRLLNGQDPPGRGFFNAFIKGKKFPHLMFMVDPRGAPFVEPEEVLLASFDDKDLGIWTSFRLQDRLQDPDHDNRLLDIQHQEIDATVKGTQLRAKVKTTVEVLVDGVRSLPFNLFPTLRVTRVAESSGQALEFVQGELNAAATLLVKFPHPLQRGTIAIEFEYAGDKAVLQMGPGNFTLYARDNWYPASTFGDRATYDMTFRSPKDLVMVATGTPQGSSQLGNEVISRWKTDVPVAVAGFNFGNFKKAEVRDDKTGYLIESYANTNPTDLFTEIKDFVIGNFNTERLRDKAANEALIAVGIFQNYFGPLPYGRLAMTQQPFIDFGQAWPMLVFMPITAFFDSTTRHNIGMTPAMDFFRIVGPHEVAHQWWGHIVGWKSYRDQWMSEGFAEFSASLFAHLVYGDEQFIDFWKDEKRRILERNHMGWRPGDVAPVTLGYRADNSRTGNVTRNVIYPKGGFILHMIRMMMHDPRAGDERFRAMMRDFVTSHYNQNVSTEDFKRIVEKHMTPDMDIAGNNKMDWFFNQYVYGTETPRYKLDYQLEPSGQQTILKMRLTQSEVSANFRMAVPVYLELEDKKLSKLGAIRILGNSTQEATITLGFRPRRVILAAYEDVLATIDQN